MSRKKVVVSDHAANSLRRIIVNLKKTSLIGGEDARAAIIQRIRRIGMNPMATSEKVNMGKMEGEYRVAKVWGYNVYYRVSENVLILDILKSSE